MMLWSSLWDMTQEAQISAVEYSNFLLSHLRAEKDFKIIDFVLKTLEGRPDRLGLLSYYHTDESIGSISEQEFRIKLESFLKQLLIKSVPESDFQKRYFDAFVKVIESAPAQTYLENILANKESLSGLEVDQDRRWHIINRLAALDYQNIDLLIKNEGARDPSGQGLENAIGARAARPGIQNKQEWFNKLFSDASMSLAQQKAAMENMFSIEQTGFRKQMDNLFFSKIFEVAKNKESSFQEVYTESLPPGACDDESLLKLRNFLAGASGLTPIMIKNLKINIQENDRCLQVKKRMLLAN